MPYLAHFKLARQPFTLTPNRALFFPELHQKLLTQLLYAVRRGEGIVKVTGEVGTGKTLLCRLLVQQLVDEAEVALLNGPGMDAGGMAQQVCREFGLTPATGQDAYLALGEHLLAVHQAGRRAVLIVDETQALDREALETLRLLSNLETDDAKLLQIVLLGQPELDETLARYDLRQLAQRITFSFSTQAFAEAAAIRYIQHRMEACRAEGADEPVFTTGALKRIARATGGVPRLINILADRSLLAAYAAGAPRVEAEHVGEALADGVPLPRQRGWLGWLSTLWNAAVR
jgi:MSHA biogenesis protein MshM